MQRAFDLPRPRTRDITVERDLRVPMPDGAVLLADRHAPRDAGPLPTILVRTPYGRGGAFGFLYGHLFAERGFQVLIQSCRGTSGSGGTLTPFFDEQADGLATIEWISRQPWFSGDLAMCGPSYLGNVQWAVAGSGDVDMRAMAAQVTLSNFADKQSPGGAYALEDTLGWTRFITKLESGQLSGVMGMLAGRRTMRRAFAHLPLADLDRIAVGRHVDYWHDWLAHPHADDPWWAGADHRAGVAEVRAPVSLVGGWYDLFLPWQLADYRALVDAGHRPHLLVGPWTHIQGCSSGPVLREALGWLRAHVLGDRDGLRALPVRLFVMGADEWRDYPEWPPPSATVRWHLQAGGGLAPDAPGDGEPSRYSYDPSDPTPAVGGPRFAPDAGRRDNRTLESRRDVLVFTSEPLEADLEVIGPVAADMFVTSSLEHTDFYVRLCDVEPSGKSFNVCDGIRRLEPGRPDAAPDGVISVRVDLWPTAYRFRRGHRVRVQVSSGAHPHYARNTGSGEPLATATRLCIAEQSVFADRVHPSAVLLPVVASPA